MKRGGKGRIRKTILTQVHDEAAAKVDVTKTLGYGR